MAGMTTQRLSLGVIGLGRVGSAIARAVAALPPSAGYGLVGLSPHRLAEPGPLADELGLPVLGAADLLCLADLAVLAVPDDALGAAARELSAAFCDEPQTAFTSVVHCSGALTPDVLGPLQALGWSTGAWHPLQAFPTTRSPLRAGITWAVTAPTAPTALADHLTALSRALGGCPFALAAEHKSLYHAAASTAANYLVTVTSHATGLLAGCGLGRDDALAALLPLLSSTLDGLAEAGLPGGLTGPLARGDLGTVTRHLAAVRPYPGTDALYRAAGRATLPLLRARGMDEALVERIEALLESEPSRLDSMTAHRAGSSGDGLTDGPRP